MSAQAQPARLEVLRSTQTALKKLGRETAELAMVAVTCDVKPIGIDAAMAAARDRLGRKCPGWARHQSGIYRSDKNPPAGKLSEMGPPLFGEWAIDAGHSVHLRPDPWLAGGLTEWTYGERPLPADEALQDGETPALRQRLCVLANPLEEAAGRHETLVYHVFWGASDEGEPYALRRLFARFAGSERQSVTWRRGKGG